MDGKHSMQKERGNAKYVSYRCPGFHGMSGQRSTFNVSTREWVKALTGLAQ